jgi:transcriptional regulator with XRE-family HTH domain
MSAPDGQASPTASEGSASGREAGSQSLPRAGSSAGSDSSVRALRSAGSIAPTALAPIRGTVVAAAARTAPGGPATVDFVAHGAAATAAVVVTAAVGSAVSAAIEFGRFGHGWAGGLVFNTWLRRQLRERRMSQRHLAQLAGIDHSTISRLLHGRTPSLDTATRLAQALGAPFPEGVPVASENSLDSMLPTARVERALRGDEELSDEDVRRVMDTYLALRARRRRLRADEGSDPGAGQQ